MSMSVVPSQQPSMVVGMLCYTMLPKTATSEAGIGFLLWKDKKPTLTISTAYFSQLICEKMKEDRDVLDTAIRSFHTKTKGVFAPTEGLPKKNVTEKHRIEEGRKKWRPKLIEAKGCTVIMFPPHRLYVCPVKYVPIESLTKTCLTTGTPEWVSAPALFSALSSAVTTNVDVHVTSISGTDCALHLPFVAVLRSAGALDEIKDILSTFGDTIKAIATATAQQSEKDKLALQNANAKPLTAAAGDQKSAPAPDSKHATDSAAATATGTAAAGTAVDSKSDSKSDVKSAPAASANPNANATPIERYRCWKCRFVVFTDRDLQFPAHEPMQGSFHFAGKKKMEYGNLNECGSYFLAGRISTLGDFDGSDGPIVCGNPKCGHRLGTYNWAGTQCSCGQWVVPALQVTKSKVDLRPVLTAPVSAAVVAPAAAAAAPNAIGAIVTSTGAALAPRKRVEPPKRVAKKPAATDSTAAAATTSDPTASAAPVAVASAVDVKS